MKIKTNATAFVLGFRDGWTQPHYLNWSTNVEHLPGYDAQTQEWLDRGINLGQRARAPRNYQRLEG